LTAAVPAVVADAELAALIVGAQPALHISLTPAQVGLLVAYVRLMGRWNAAYNLTAVREPRAMVVQHVLDCLAVVAPLRRRLAVAGRRLLDVGSGAGLPGLVIAAVEPRLEVVCVDSVGKKAAFITQAASALALTNLSAEHRRVEDMPDERFDVITSRAFASLADFFGATRRLLADEGSWMAMKGKLPSVEIAALPDLAFHVEPLRVPGLDAARCIVWARPIKVSASF
jgi:16S rRNA (guanine527-N7)-methyltransferase